MEAAVEKLFELLESERESILSSVRTANPVQLSIRPQPNKWCVLELLSHLLNAEQLALSYMKKKSLAIQTVRDSGWYEKVKILVFSVSQQLPLKFKAPQLLASRTQVMPLDLIEKEWSEVRSDLKQFLQSIPGQYARRMIYKHPLLGRFDCRQATQILLDHIRHHRPQILRQLRSS